MKNFSPLSLLREWLSQQSISAIIIPSNDPHFAEYVPDYYKSRAWASGFNGSAGTLVVTTSDAALWTDSRYFMQAEKQLFEGITLMKLKMAGTPSIEEWLLRKLEKSAKVAIDSKLFSPLEYNSLKQSLQPLELIPVEDPFTILWKDRPQLKANPIELMPESISGASINEKCDKIVNKFSKVGEFAFIISACDQVMWLFNLRGSDIEYNAVALSYAVVTNNSKSIFIRRDALTAEASQYLDNQGVNILEYSTFESYLKTLDPSLTRVANLAQISLCNYLALGGDSANFINDIEDNGYISHLKCRKNSVEAEGFREAFLQDGVAWCKVLKFIDDNIESGELNEYIISEKFKEYRLLSEDYRGESFEPIVAFNENAAAPHYSFDSPETSAKISNSGFLLMDTGGHYKFGTTDTTRTIPLGNLTQTQVDDYTLILKGMIQLAMAKFPEGTRGAQLDILARGPIFTAGKMYYHGTGHGIGHYLCVHESPQIRMEESPIVLDRGVVISDEPGVYLEGEYGIRIENVLHIVDYITTDRAFLAFETLTKVPISTECINKELLGKEALDWLNNYNSRVFDALSPYLNSSEKEWLSSKTRMV